MTDIVERLRAVPLYESHGEESSLPEQAADTIEALQARVKELEGERAKAESRVNIIMRSRTDFTGDPPFSGADGIVAALLGALDQRDE